MSLLPYATQGGIGLPFYIPINQQVSTLSVSTLTTDNIIGKTLTVSTISTNTLSANSTFTGFIETPYGESSNWYVDNTLYVNFQQLTADADQLFLNGVPIATTANLSSIQDWSIYAQISTLDGNGQDIKGTNLLQAKTIGVSTMGVCNLTGVQGAFTNLFTQNLMAANIVNFTSTVIEVYESTVRSDIKLANISTLNAQTLSCGSISTNTITANVAVFSTFTGNVVVPTGNFSNITTGGLTVNCNAVFNSNINFVNLTQSGGFGAANTFNGLTSFSAAVDGTYFTASNAFLGPLLSNTGAMTVRSQGNLQLYGCNALLADSLGTTIITNNVGCNVSLNSLIRLNAKNGNRGRIELNADIGYAYIQGEISLNAASGAIPSSGPSFGGRVTINAQSAGVPTGPTIFYPSYVLQTADSLLNYAGPLTPITGTYGYNYVQGFNGVNIVAGTAATIPNVPGTVYLYGTNAAGTGNSGGVRVQNGISVDTIYPFPTGFTGPSYDLTLKGNAAGNMVTLSNVRNVYGGNASNQANIYNFSNINCYNLNTTNINGAPYSGGGGGGGWVSTATSDLDMNGYNIVAPTILSISTPFLYLQGSAVTAIVTSNAVIDATQDIRLNSPSNIYMSTQTVDFQESLLRGAVYGQSLGAYQPFKFIYEPPTAAGQSAEFSIQAHPQDAGVVYNLRYGVDMAGGFGYLYCEWPGYIVVPMKISGKDVIIGDGETVVLNTNNEIYNNTKGGFHVSSLTTELNATNSITFTSPTTKIDSATVTRSLSGAGIPQGVFQQGATSGSGVSGNVSVTIPTGYTTSNSYSAFVSQQGTSPANTSVQRNTSNAFTIYWTNAGGGTQNFDWMTLGT